MSKKGGRWFALFFCSNGQQRICNGSSTVRLANLLSLLWISDEPANRFDSRRPECLWPLGD